MAIFRRSIQQTFEQVAANIGLWHPFDFIWVQRLRLGAAITYQGLLLCQLHQPGHPLPLPYCRRSVRIALPRRLNAFSDDGHCVVTPVIIITGFNQPVFPFSGSVQRRSLRLADCYHRLIYYDRSNGSLNVDSLPSLEGRSGEMS